AEASRPRDSLADRASVSDTAGAFLPCPRIQLPLHGLDRRAQPAALIDVSHVCMIPRFDLTPCKAREEGIEPMPLAPSPTLWERGSNQGAASNAPTTVFFSLLFSVNPPCLRGSKGGCW